MDSCTQHDLVEEHQSWMDERSCLNNSWENTPTGQRASEEHDVLEDLAYHVEEWKDALENIEQDIDNDLSDIEI